MKVFTKLGMAFLMAIWASGMLWAQNSSMEIAPNANNTPYASEVIFDLQFDYPVGIGGGEAGIETDGNFIYTSMWNGAGEFQRYGMDGAWIETITVAGSNGCRDIAYDGTYFYGGAASTTIFEMDLANATMVSTFTGPADCRAVAYNEDDDAFYCNNWSSDITKFNKAGANLGSFAIGASAASYYGLAFQGAAYCGDGPFLWGYSQTGATSNELIQMDLPSGTETGLTFDVGSVAAVGAGIAGGMAIAQDMVSGFWTILGTSQNVDIWGLELCSAGPLPTNDVGISAITSPVSGSGLTSSETVTVSVKNFGTAAQSNIPVSFTVDGGTAVNETVTNTINGGDSFDFTFAGTADLSAPGDHIINSCTGLAGDENAANDCKTATVSNMTQAMAYPQSADDWTGTCTVAAKTDVSYVRAYGGDGTTNEQGWMMFDVSGVPAGSTINWIKFHGYVANTNWPYWSITPMPIDPITSTAADIFNTASAGSGTDVAYSYNNEGSSFAPGWYEYDLVNSASTDLAASLAQGWFAVGIWERDGSATYFLELDGWNETNVPYLEIDYSAASTVGSLDGTVTDATTTSPIQGATVSVAGLSTTTLADGTYSISNVPTGAQSVDCSATGYDPANATVTIQEGLTATQDFALNASATLAPPSNLVAEVIDPDVNLSWDAASGGGGSGQWIQWDAGTNTGNGIGLTNGGTFYCASHWTPADLAAYDGQSISKISFFANGDPAATYELMAWIGPDAGTVLMTQPVATFVVDDFNEIDLTSNILIDATDELWIGYAVTHGPGTFPAGCDDGPAVAYSGDMISLDGSSWVSMSTDYGLDYNWNIAAFVLDSKSSNPIAQPISKLAKTQFVPGSFGSAADAGLAGNTVTKFVPDAVKALLGYNVYRDGLLIGFTATTTYVDAGLASGTYSYHVTALYDEGESDPSNTVTVTVGGSANVLFADDFEAYTAGQQIACQNPDDWTTWSNLPCDATEDAYISDAYAYSGVNSAVIVQNNDLVNNLDTYLTSGVYNISQMVYVPTGFDGYYNVMSDFDGAYEWALEVYFNVGGDGSLNAGGTGAATFNFNFDTWMECMLVLDLDNDWAQYYIDGTMIYEWQWTLGAAGGGSQLQLAAFDFFGATATTQMYFDDFMIEEAPMPPPSAIFEDDFESYNAGEQLACQNPTDWTTWSNDPCSAEDPYIVDDGGNNVVEVTGTNDCVYAMPNYTSGFYTITFDMLIPAGNDAYFNTLQEFAGGSSEWGMQVYFYAGAGSVDAGGAGAATFVYSYDTWMAMQIDVDLDNDWAEYYLDGTLIIGWQWSTGTFGTGSLNQLGGNNFYAGADTQPPLYHFDNYVLSMSTPPPLFADDFEAYTAGEQVACQNPTDWTTWSNLPCDATEDAYISDVYAYSGVNSAVIVQNNDLVKNLDTYYTSGVFDQSMMVYVPTGSDGYYNTMSDFDGAYEWAMEVYFNVGGDGSLNAGGTGAATFVFNFDIWMNCHLHLDLDNDWAQYYIDDVLIYEWQWTLGAAGGGSQLQLAAFDFFGATATTQMYMDDFMLDGVPGQFNPPENVNATVAVNDVTVTWDPPASGTPDGYNVYRNDANIDYVAAPTTTYTDMGLANGTYTYCVTAVYGGGESTQACATPVTVNVAPPPGPFNLDGTTPIYEGQDVDLTWDMPGNSWMQWDAGTNTGNGIGLTDGGAFNCSAHWTPADLNDYNGLTLTQISFFPNADPDATFVLKVWTGVNGDVEVMSQTVTSFTVDDFNEVILDNPVVIDGSTDLWIGYEVTHGAGTFPAGCDDGPAVAYKGDMINLGGASWVSMSTDYGLDYNWNIAGYVELLDGKTAQMGKVVNFPAANGLVEASGSTGELVKFVPSSVKDLLYYNVYRAYNSGSFGVIGTSTVTSYTDVAVAPFGQYHYYVTAVWDAGESDPSNTKDVDVLLGVEEMLANSTQVYPNPATEVVNIESDFTIESITVYNHAGQIVVNQEINNKLYQVNTSEYQSGIYFIQINTTEGQISKRVIIK